MHRLENNPYSPLNQHIKERLKPVTISIAPLDNISAVEMINEYQLEGWCWQSTTFLSVFFDNESTVSRGNLTLPTYSRDDYFHSWIELGHKNKRYVFDPALNYLYQKDDYYNEFNVRTIRQIQASKIRDSLIDLVDNSHEKSIYIPGTDNIEDPFFRTNSKVSVKTDSDKKIEELDVRFYFNG